MELTHWVTNRQPCRGPACLEFPVLGTQGYLGIAAPVVQLRVTTIMPIRDFSRT